VRWSLVPIMVFLVMLANTSPQTLSAQSWTPIQSELPRLTDMTFTSIDTGYTVGPNGWARKTIDGGATWQQMDLPVTVDSTTNFATVTFINKTIGYVGGAVLGRSLLLRTTNAGASWSRLNLDLPYAVRGLSFPRIDTGYLTAGTSSPTLLLKTIDSGSTWQTIHSSENLQYVDIAFRDATHGVYTAWASNPASFELFNSSSGLAYEDNRLQIVNGNLSNPTYILDRTWVVANERGILRSTNDGIDWAFATTPRGRARFDYFAFHDSIGYACSEFPDRIFKTTDAGNSWLPQMLQSRYFFYGVAASAPSANVAYVLTSQKDSAGVLSYVILKTTDGGGVTSGVISEPAHIAFSVLGNPATLVAIFHLPRHFESGQLEIFDLMGSKRLSVLASPSAPKLSVDVRTLSNGIYWCRLGSSAVKLIIVH
jgi:photosystem II stability/assembly factor-like uncharacterized protein